MTISMTKLCDRYLNRLIRNEVKLLFYCFSKLPENMFESIKKITYILIFFNIIIIEQKSRKPIESKPLNECKYLSKLLFHRSRIS